ncbi:MAG: hypothetical protein GY804_01100 [Alphaproteobacteria bacterium]|nr:hypothetical protein [Alphaproteobacteria bacterium]
MSFLGKFLNMGIDSDGTNINVFDGIIQAKNFPATDGKIVFVDAANGSDTAVGLTPATALATLSAAYAKVASNNGDVIYLINNGTAITEASQILWTKSGITVVGVNGIAGGINKGVVVTFTDNTATGQLLVSGDGNLFVGVQFNHTPSSAAGVISVAVTGDNNTFIECQFLNANNAASADAAGYLGVNLNGCANPSFFRCTIGGTDTERTDGAADLTIGAGTITGLYMEDCIFIANLNAAADADHAFIEQIADADLGDIAYLVKPTFINAGANAALPDAMTVGASTAGFWLVRDPLLVYITDICDNEEKVWCQQSGRDTTPGQFVGQAINPAV